ncbi:MAG: sulfurtransferase complex subunit TusD [Halioglobus sp.]|nr:sulfurtransferase complex subunit TusD [Halioglobus sp.]
MIYSLLVLSDPTQGSMARNAAAFARALLDQGHELHRVFFLDKGVLCGSASAVYPQDETSPLHDWVSLAEEHGVDLVLCVTSALRQGMLDAHEAKRHERTGATIHPAFTISGLGQLIDAGAVADRLVTFGG